MSSQASTRTAMKDNRDLTRDPVAKRASAFHSTFSTLIATGSRVSLRSPGMTFHSKGGLYTEKLSPHPQVRDALGLIN